jgi:hypothetical protein
MCRHRHPPTDTKPAHRIQQIDELVGTCEADIGCLTPEERTMVESWLPTRDRFLTVIPVAAVLAGRQRLNQPTVDSNLTESTTQ